MSASQTAQPADAVPQLTGAQCPGGSVMYICSGPNDRGGKCGKLLFVWASPPRDLPGKYPDYGRIEVKCRRCKTLCFVLLDADPP